MPYVSTLDVLMDCYKYGNNYCCIFFRGKDSELICHSVQEFMPESHIVGVKIGMSKYSKRSESECSNGRMEVSCSSKMV